MTGDAERNFKMVIGITGGVGSGKSRILKILKEEYGARIIIADQVAHRLMEPGEAGYIQVVKKLGSRFIKTDGSVDKSALADLIFKEPETLKTVNGIIHPLVWIVVKEEISIAHEPLIAVEAAIVQEKGNDIYNEMWYVYTSEENRIRRLMDGRGYTEEKCHSIMANQMTEEGYKSICQRVIDNNGSLEETRNQISAILTI